MEQVTALKRSCIGHLGNLTRRYKELEQLFVNYENQDAVQHKYDQLKGMFLLYENKYHQYIALLSGDELQDAMQQFESYRLNKEEFQKRLSGWMEEATKQQNGGDDDDGRRSVRSNQSARSIRTASSTTSSMKLREARAKQRLMQKKLEQLRERQKLDRERLELEARMAEMDIVNEKENADLEAEFWAQEIADEGKPANIAAERDVEFGNVEVQLPNNQVVHENVRVESEMYKKTLDSKKPGETVSTTQLCNMLMLSMNMPKPDMITFDGDPIKYWNFMNSFDVNVASKISDDRMKLMYLVQFCEGKAKESIECCVLMDPHMGYMKAREILAEQYGQPHVITNALMREVLDRHQIRPNDGAKLVELARQMRKCEITLTQMGHAANLNSSETLLKIQQILPVHMQVDWAKRAQTMLRSRVEPNFSHMTEFIEQHSQVASNVYGQNIGKSTRDVSQAKKGGRSSSGKRLTSFSTQGCEENQPTKENTERPRRKCPLCLQDHDLFKCKDFLAKTPKERLREVRRKRLCDNCLKPSHIASECRSSQRCKNDGCGMKHHTLLHFQRDSSSVSNQTGAGASNNNPQPQGTNLSTIKQGKVCLRVLPVKVRGNGKEVTTCALLDQGSDVTLCDERLVKELGLKGSAKELELTTINQQNHKVMSVEVDMTVTGIGKTEIIQLDSVWTVKKLPISESSMPHAEDVERWPHLKGLELPNMENNEVMLLIGGDVPEAFWVMEERRGGRKDPYAIRSPLGWTLIGPTNNTKRKTDFKVNFVHNKDEQLQQQVERFWYMDFGGSTLGAKVGESLEDKRARSKMDQSITKVDGHYQLGLPWRHENPCLPDNLTQAEARLQYLKRRLKRDPQLHQRYTATMEGYLDKGYAKEVEKTAQGEPQDGDSRNDRTNKTWYLPHHPVLHPRKPDKTRVVFDCAAQYKGISLNSQLLQGPDYTNSLVGVLTRFRQEKIALVADIEAMFHQVRVTPEDCEALRFLWWPGGDYTKEPKHYKMLVHLFGATSSPSCAGYALRKTAEDNQTDENEAAVKAVQENFYVDDCLTSVGTKEEAVKLCADLRELLSKGGFRLTKWVSNDHDVLQTIPVSERSTSILDLHLDDMPVERTLGVLWNVGTDQFGFRVSVKDKPATRRGILSITSSLYDPLGFAAPFILVAKILLQDMCAKGLGWDEEVGDSECMRWQQWLEELPQLERITIDRCLKPTSEVSQYELHAFCDASMRGYAAAVYLRTTSTDGSIKCTFVMGKTRLCPLKTMTIPRLELSAAVLACSLMEVVKAELKLPISTTTYWTDSTSVLKYIRNESRRFHTFVANRITKIQSVSDPSEWRHVDTKSNPADDGSRGLQAREMTSDCRWICGPEFLQKPQECWPQPPTDLGENDDLAASGEVLNDPEVKKGLVNLTTADPVQKLTERYSTWNGLKRGVAWILRYKEYLRMRVSGNPLARQMRHDLTAKELEVAELEIVKHVQMHAFPEEMRVRSKADSVKLQQSSRLAKLNPIVHDGVLRVGGRLAKAPLSDDVKHPLILPHDHHVTNLLVSHFHEEVGHSGAGMTWTALREKFWILRGGATVRKVIGNCFKCKRRNSPRGEQFMADLPRERVTPNAPPFTNTGVDFFGPFQVKRGRSQVKRYGCIFTCLASRAVHLEVAHSLDTDSFINALRRFINRRGRPKKIHSDNGTNFKSGYRELKESLTQLNSQKVGRFLTQKGIEWEFNPPGASHMGGVWERVIRAVRRILSGLLKEQLVTDEALTTLMTEVEAILNARPLTQLSMDSNDDEPLTPNHLLLLRQNPSLPQELSRRRTVTIGGDGVRSSTWQINSGSDG
ncbi:uncharacterized protein [Diadema antillarum]|uniref:uncharacterized protein n=1 Tax=Diadema antillarum TaxID=105358 RepID=UPI003A8948E0